MWTYDFGTIRYLQTGRRIIGITNKLRIIHAYHCCLENHIVLKAFTFHQAARDFPLPPPTVRNMVWNNCVGRKIFNGFLCTWYANTGTTYRVGTNFGKLFRIFHFYHGMAYHRISRFQNLLSNYCLLYTSDTGCKEWWLPRREMLSFLSPPPKVEKIFLSQNAYWKVFFQRRNCWMAWRT